MPPAADVIIATMASTRPYLMFGLLSVGIFANASAAIPPHLAVERQCSQRASRAKPPSVRRHSLSRAIPPRDRGHVRRRSQWSRLVASKVLSVGAACRSTDAGPGGAR
ncbi:hypothetical protein HBI56_096150 [Parastagonospora nodorum]|uniref:Uncharacterized protein n=1 Tax=Phaeosphaeria nodorum (strain SN15 / ATCC MYA-4574 / FGSC 10173) TaxID=321614 RepID=A0A7U2F426_PHANO|nr:hypothetical protein HBH56_091540 [Parastagonospora nodorum]QRC98306.1 hypothetical protein JI435_303180 [Parastagonospora nodorum SN15]KAH3936595.1 hypothetical protein HBH54_026180 [Parastagonospora nodorum]KAH3940494.1 hypothetical protein HBH53_216250 [Parastagonospora nodorum]KAH3957660.1 hypothetical protein HBH51_221050 [Parastagonospora nodorum]